MPHEPSVDALTPEQLAEVRRADPALVESLLGRRAAMLAGLGLAAALLAGCKNKQRAGKWKPLSDEELNGPPRRELYTGSGRPTAGRPGDFAPVQGVLPRRAWTTAQPAAAYINPMNGITRITVHHAGFAIASRNQNEVARLIEGMRRDHTTNRKDGSGRPWADIGYHYLIDPAGRIWEGRSIRYQGAHVRNNNENNLGIQVMGNFDDQRPTSEQMASLDAFVADRARAYRVPINRIFTHQELMPTACPGQSLQAYMEQTRSSRGRIASAMA